jgi:hypothetical protein
MTSVWQAAPARYALGIFERGVRADAEGLRGHLASEDRCSQGQARR